MVSEFKTIGLIGRIGSELVLDSLKALMAFLIERQRSIILEQEISKVLPGHQLPVCDRNKIGELCDLVIVVGGDGSMLTVARDLACHGVPVLGINRGGLGFLTDVPPVDFEPIIEAVLNGEFTVEKRFLLDAEVYRGLQLIGRGSAFNDVVVSSGETARMIEFETYIEEQFVYSQRSDGLIIATPTGSTAYALSAGGPIMHPSLDALVLVPMFPHSLSSRPIVIDGNSVVKIKVASDNFIHPVVTCDGHFSIDAEPGDMIIVRKKPHRLTMIHPLGHNFYAACRDKLGWGNKLTS